MPEAVNYCIRCGSPVRMELKYGAQRPVCPRCGWIYFADPKVAVEVLVEKGDQVLLVKRANQPQLSLWSQPGGFVDAWEDPARAAERECLEETGLAVKVTSLLDVISGREFPESADIVLAYRAEIVGGELIPGDDALQVGFFSRNALPPLAFKASKKILLI